MRYFKKLAKSLTDEKDVGVEMILIWIAGMLTLLAVFAIIDVLVRGFGA